MEECVPNGERVAAGACCDYYYYYFDGRNLRNRHLSVYGCVWVTTELQGYVAEHRPRVL